MKRNMLAVLATSIIVSSFLVPGVSGAAEVGKSKVTILASAQKAAALSSVSIVVDGKASTVRALQTGGTTLYAVRDLASALHVALEAEQGNIYLYGGQPLHVIQFQPNVKSYQADGVTLEFTQAPVSKNGVLYVELDALVTALGGERTTDKGELQFARYKKLDGDFSAPRWNASGKAVVTRTSDAGIQVYAFNPTTAEYQQLSANEDAADLAVSPDGKWGAYTDANSQLHLIDLASGSTQTWGSDSSVKTDLSWSPDSKLLYFAQGDKQEKIASINLDAGTVKTIVNDKVENKSNIRIAADGKTLLYAVSITGVAKNDADSTEESLTIDYTNAGDQLYILDTSVKEGKPVQITTGKDNKLYASLLNDGRVVYVSADPDGTANANLSAITISDKKTTILVDDIDVTVAALSASGQLFVAGTSKDGSTKVYEVKADGKKNVLYSTSGSITELTPSANGTSIAAIEDGSAIVISEGKATKLSK
ncbi:hypothetical protein MH117_20505 [Paenibacillus sp. ACRRX]|uniref:hypothetical protein n=1 Tax=Paenibacillus sp. ACRRX TaxID=2918206 RepID=UPI001EF4F8A9|nr:hypothetical protein [Paenibacillus sp. ACRRX]MCG7409792.1 hypothetical protein [Paenibacillus sp. ACRRX]